MKSSIRQHLQVLGSQSKGANFVAAPFSGIDVGKTLDKDIGLTALVSTFDDIVCALLPGDGLTTSFPGG